MLVLILISILDLDSQSSIQTYPMLFCATSSPPVIRKMFSVLLTSDTISTMLQYMDCLLRHTHQTSQYRFCDFGPVVCFWTMLFNFFKIQTTVHWTVSTFGTLITECNLNVFCLLLSRWIV